MIHVMIIVIVLYAAMAGMTVDEPINPMVLALEPPKPNLLLLEPPIDENEPNVPYFEKAVKFLTTVATGITTVWQQLNSQPSYVPL